MKKKTKEPKFIRPNTDLLKAISTFTELDFETLEDAYYKGQIDKKSCDDWMKAYNAFIQKTVKNFSYCFGIKMKTIKAMCRK
jgi:hypothetical protein